MSSSIVVRPLGPTSIIAVSTTASTPLLITQKGNDQCTYAEFANTGTVPVAIRISQLSNAAVHPVAGTPGDYTLNHDTSVILAVPSSPYYVSAITVSGSSTLYVTPVDSQ
jgi:hypothetical protein